MQKLPDIKPQTAVAFLNREKYNGLTNTFDIEKVSKAVGMSVNFIKKICGKKRRYLLMMLYYC